MKQNYTTQVLRTVAAQVCQTIGWQSVTASSLEIMVEILDRYMKEICKTTHDYAELYNRTEANLDDLGLTFRDMGIDMNEILEYVSYVDPIVPIHEVPKYPIPKETHLNFLKPGSKEVLTRPVHIHEHLPPLNPPEDEPLYSSLSNEKEIDVVGGIQVDDDGIFKRPNDGGLDGNAAKKMKSEDEGRPTREISSVMMTTSGFISPAREGKLPDSKLPYLPPEFTRPVTTPASSPPYKSSKDSSGLGLPSAVDKKLEKKLRKKNQEKEKRKEKPVKEKHVLGHDPHDIIPMHSPGIPQPPAMMPREANEQQIMADRKKALKELKKKTKAEMVAKKKKEKPPKAPKQTSFDAGLFEPFPVIPPALPAQSQSQALNFLTGAAHSMFQNPMLDNVFAHNPIVEGKLITEPDKNKLNIFKKITKPKDEPKAQAAIDFLSPPKFDRFDQPSTSQQVYNDPMKKVHKLPKETTMTRVDDAPINFSMSRSAESSFEELAMPKTPSVPRTPDIKQTVEKKEKKERKKREKKVEQPDWNQSMQNSFMPDLATQNNPFLQTLQGPGGFMGNLGNFNALRNSFGMQSGNMFNTGAGLLGQQSFGMGQLNPMNQMLQNTYGFPLPGMDMNMLQQAAAQPPKAPKPKKVKPPKPPAMFKEDDFRLMQGSKFGNLAPAVPQQQQQQSFSDRFDGLPLMNVDPFPLQHHQQSLVSFDQLLKAETKQSAPLKSVSDDKIQTFDLTSSPEPMVSPPAVMEPVAPAYVEPSPAIVQQQQLPAVKEKSKEKKKKKDKDKDKDDHKKKKKDKKEKKKKKEKRKEKNRASMSTQDSQSTGDTEDTGDNMSTASSVPKLMLKLNSPRPSTPEIHKKMLQRRNEDFDFPSPSSHDTSLNREPSPELVRISPLVTRPPKAKPAKRKDDEKSATSLSPEEATSPGKEGKPKPVVSPETAKLELPTTPKSSHRAEGSKRKLDADSIVDSDGSTVWICPACGKVDDGTPMIGCDACDAWYHWACVGIKVEPKDDEDWFCRACIARKQSDQMDGKKKKRKKKDKDKRDH